MKRKRCLEEKFDCRTREGRNAYLRAHRIAFPDYYRNYDLKRTFGIDLLEYQKMWVAQKGVCAICDQPETSKRSGKIKWLAVDHNHETGCVRGLLCSSCNKAIGFMRENPQYLREAATYVERHSSGVTFLRRLKG